MARSILGVIVGYLVMAALVFLTFTLAYLAMGADRAFKPGTYDASTLWLVLSFILGIIAALSGGAVCRLLAPTMTPVYVLAGIALVLGILLAIPVLTADTTAQQPRTGDVPNMEAMTKAHTPAAAALLNPIIGAAGIVLGGMLIEKRRRATPGL